MTGDFRKVPDAEAVESGPIVLSSTDIAPTLEDVQTMFKSTRVSAGRDVVWLWKDARADKTFKLRAWYPVIQDREFWDYELRDDPTWTFSDDRLLGNPVIWQYKTSDQHLVFEITKMADKEEGEIAAIVAQMTARAQAGVASVDGTINAMYSSKTGLLTYPAFLLFAQREYEWFSMYGNPVSLAVFDIRSRKVGEKDIFLPPETISLVGKRLMRRLSDTLGHFEGFDLGLLMPNTDMNQAYAIAQRAMQILSALPLGDQESHGLSVTCGLACIPANGTELRHLILGARLAKSQAVDTCQALVAIQPGSNIPMTDLPYKRSSLKDTGPITVRDLMLRTNLVGVEQYDTALNFSQRMRTPIVRVLAMEGHVKEATLDAAVEIETLSQNVYIPIEDAIRAVRLVEDHQLDLDTAMRRIGLNKGGIKLSHFARLIRDSGLIPVEDLKRANQQSIAARESLCVVLLKHGMANEVGLRSVLRVLRMVGKAFSRDDGIKILEELKGGIPLETILQRVGLTEPASSAVALGESLLQEGTINIVELLNAYETELNENKSLETVLLELGVTNAQAIALTKQRIGL